MIGSNEGAARNLSAAVALAVACQTDPNNGVIEILDATPDTDANAGQLGRVARFCPAPVEFVPVLELGAWLERLEAEVKRRQANPSEAAPTRLADDLRHATAA